MTVLNTADAFRAEGLAVDAVYLGSTQVWSSTPSGVSEATLTIPAGKVASTLTGFVTRVDLSTMPAGWWSDVASDGGNIRVKRAGAVIPFDLVAAAPALKMGELYFKATLDSATDNVFTIDKSGAALLATTDPNGRNAVWADYYEVYIGDLASRTGSGHDLTAYGASGLTNWPIVDASPNVDAHQGVAVDTEGNFYVIDTNAIKKFDPDWNLLATNSNPIGATGLASVNHLGDATVYGGELYIPLEVYPNSPYNNQHVTVWNLADLTFNRSYDISVGGHETSSICHADDGYWYITDWTTPAGDGVLHKYDSSFTHVGTLALSTTLQAKQGVAYHAGHFYISTDDAASATNRGVWRFDADGTNGVQLWSGKFSAGIEGIAADAADNLYVLHDDGASTSYITKHAYSALRWLTAGSGYSLATGLTALTQWTIGVSYVNVEYNRHRAIASWGTSGSNNGYRATIAINNTSEQLGAWNSSDTWLFDTSSTVSTGVRERVHHTYNGTTDRKLWRHGTLRATDSGVVQRPLTGNYFYLGSENSLHNENFNGVLGLAYIRNGTLSADWIAAEAASWEDPSSFFDVS